MEISHGFFSTFFSSQDMFLVFFAAFFREALLQAVLQLVFKMRIRPAYSLPEA